MKRLLMVLYQFPPCNDVGSYRPIKFIKNLQKFEWYPIILAPRNGIFFSYDYQIENTLNKKCTIYRSPFLLPFNFLKKLHTSQGIKLHKLLWRIWNRLAMPDGAVSWIPSTVFLGKKLVEKEDIDIIFASGQPFSTFIIAYLIKKLSKKKNLKLILDYRDPWTLNPFFKGSKLRKGLERKIETAILRQMDAAILSSDESLELQYKGFKKITDRTKFYTITNSFEKNSVKQVADIKREEFSIVYAGNLYGTRNPHVFLRGLSLAKIFNKDFASKVRVDFYGNYDNKSMEEIIHKLNITSMVNLYPRIPQTELFPILNKAHVLLLINSYGPGHHIFIPAKFFDYLKMRTPILCLTEDGALKRVIQRTNAGLTVEPHNEDQVAQALLDLYITIFVKKGSYSFDEDRIWEYESLYTTKRLVNLCNKLLIN